MFFWFIYILPFETSATASCGYMLYDDIIPLEKTFDWDHIIIVCTHHSGMIPIKNIQRYLRFRGNRYFIIWPDSCTFVAIQWLIKEKHEALPYIWVVVSNILITCFSLVGKKGFNFRNIFSSWSHQVAEDVWQKQIPTERMWKKRDETTK